MTLSDTQKATLRTAINTFVLAVVTFVVDRWFTDLSLDATHPLFIVGVPIVVAIFYRASLTLAEEFPWLGRVLFGATTPPTYPTPDPSTRQETP